MEEKISQEIRDAFKEKKYLIIDGYLENGYSINDIVTCCDNRILYEAYSEKDWDALHYFEDRKYKYQDVTLYCLCAKEALMNEKLLMYFLRNAGTEIPRLEKKGDKFVLSILHVLTDIITDYYEEANKNFNEKIRKKALKVVRKFHQLLLRLVNEVGMEINIESEDNSTPLSYMMNNLEYDDYACYKDYQVVVDAALKIMIDNGARVGVGIDDPISMIAFYLNSDLLKYVIEKKEIDVDVHGLDGRNILLNVCMNAKWINNIKTVIGFSKNINGNDNNGETCLSYVLGHSNYFIEKKIIAEELIKGGADIFMKVGVDVRERIIDRVSREDPSLAVKVIDCHTLWFDGFNSTANG